MDVNGFPLPASIFERYMLLDDRPSHPMQSFLEIELRGDLSVAALQHSLPEALARHPLMSSTICRSGSTDFHWQFCSTPPVIELLAAEAPLPLRTVLDLEQFSGLRLWVRPRRDGLSLILLVHHAVSDALGMLTFLMEWLALATGQKARLPESTVPALPTREDLRGIPAAFSRRQRWRNITRYLFGKPPVALALPEQNEQRQPDSVPAEESTYHTVCLTDEESDILKQAARSCQASLNDCLSAALFLTLQDWDRTHRPEPTSWPWRVLVPVNRRPSHQPFHSACNLIGYKMLTRSRKQVQGASSLLASIRDEMRPVRQHPRGVHNFVKMLSRVSRVGLLNRTVQRYDCFATVILSNLGDLDRYFAPLLDSAVGRPAVGGIGIHQIRCAPPRRPNTHLTIVAMTSGRTLQLVASRVSPGLDDAMTLEFLQKFRETMGRLAGEVLAGNRPATVRNSLQVELMQNSPCPPSPSS